MGISRFGPGCNARTARLRVESSGQEGIIDSGTLVAGTRPRTTTSSRIPSALAILCVLAGSALPGCQQSGDTTREERTVQAKESFEPRLKTSPPGKVMVINANLREAHPNWLDDIRAQDRVTDLEDMTELANFADHLKGHVPFAPDVLLLQEVIGPSARRTALELERTLGRPYQVVIAGGDRNVIGPTGDDFKHKRNTAIVINERTMKVVGEPGFTTIRMRPGDEPPKEQRIGQEQAFALLRDRESGLMVSAMSIHGSTTYHFKSTAIATQRRIEWARVITNFMEARFPDVDISVMAGELNVPRCIKGNESIQCDESLPWKIITSRANSYHDAVYTIHRSSPEDFVEQITNRSGNERRIDYIFAKPTIYRASRSIDYNEEMFTPGFISDHKYDYALVGR